MRFRLHTTQGASSGQVTTNTTALDALLLRVANLESTGSTTGGIVIATGVNDTFIFEHTAVTPSNPTETYTLVLAERSYTSDEIVAALNAAVVAHDASFGTANSITTTIALVDGKIGVRCTSAAGTTIVRAIDVLDSSACTTLGFVVDQSIGPTVSGDLILVATNAPTVTATDNNTTVGALSLRIEQLESAALVTSHVTGEYPVPTVGTILINDAEETAVTFADEFDNGVSHSLDASIFNVTSTGDYNINVQLQVTSDSDLTDRATYWVSCRRYQNRTTTETIGTTYRDYYLGNASANSFRGSHTCPGLTMGGNVRVHFESTTEQFQIIVGILTQGSNQATRDIAIDNSASWVTIERHGAAITESADDTIETATIEIVPTVTDVFAFRHTLAMTPSSATYTINLSAGVYTTAELVTILNASIEEQGSVANLITTEIVYIGGRFTIRCSSTVEHPYGIDILPNATAAVSLGFAQDQVAGVFGSFTSEDIFGSDLEMVAVNTPP